MTLPEASWLPSAYDQTIGNVRYVVQATEDGYYGFAFGADGKQKASMIGPKARVSQCLRLLREVSPPGLRDA